MNLKKYIKLKEEPREIELTEEEEELFNSLLPRVKQNAAARAAAKKRVSLWKILTPLVSVLGAVAITLICVFATRTPNEFLYNEVNIKSEKSSFTEMQNYINIFDLNYIENDADLIFMSYDSESNHKLYFSVSADIDYSSIELVVVINEKFDYKFEMDEDVISRQLADYSITYCSSSSRGDPQITYRGWIQVKTEIVYFNYIQIPAMGDTAFFKTIQQIIQLKK